MGIKRNDCVILLSDIVDDTGNVVVQAGTRGTVTFVDVRRKRASVDFGVGAGGVSYAELEELEVLWNTPTSR